MEAQEIGKQAKILDTDADAVLLTASDAQKIDIQEEAPLLNPDVSKSGKGKSPSGKGVPAQSLRPSNTQIWCIRMLWFILGATNPFPGVALRFFQVNDLKASPHVQAVMGVLTGIAWNLKMPVAFTSDVVPIMGYRRKPYLFFGLAMYIMSYFGLALLPPAVVTATTLIGFATLGQMTMGVMCDTLIVENMRHETDENKGRLQTECWILMTLAGIGGTLGGGFVFYLGVGNRQVFVINALAKLAILPFAFLLTENRVLPRTESESRVRDRTAEVWGALQDSRVWKPSLFIFLFSVFPNPGTAMTNFYINELGFNEQELSYIAVVASVSGAAGMGIYYRYFRGFNWHWFFGIVIVLFASLSLTQLILVFHINRSWGIPDLAFALGDEPLVDITCALLAMPILILIAAICPAGVESSLYALVSSVQMAGSTVGGTISAILIEKFGITLTEYSGLWRLIILCAAVKLLILPAIPMLPANLSISRDIETSKSGAGLILILLVGGIGWSVGQSIYMLAQTKD